MGRSAYLLVTVVAMFAVLGVTEGQSSFWCDGGEQQERIYGSLNSLRYNDDFKSWTNSTGWAVSLTDCEEVPVGHALFSNCTVVEEGLYQCEGSGVSIEARATLAVYPCVEVEVEDVTVYNCTLSQEECTSTLLSSGDHLCPCQWYGVDCDSAEELVALDLSSNNLSILLPDLFYDDIYVSIDFSKNLVYGELSDLIGNLQALTSLDLSKNDFHGQPPGSLGDLTGLTDLNIKSNFFTGFYPDYLVSPGDYWPDMERENLHFSDNKFWCPAPAWCISEDSECYTCEDIPSQDGCSAESQYACDQAVACCYSDSWNDSCTELATEAGEICTSPGFNWLLLFVCLGIVGVIILIGAVVAMLLTRRGQNFLIMFTRNKKNLIVVDDEEESGTGLYDIYPDEY